MKTCTVAVLGATGAVGREMLKILEERNFPVGKLIPLASARSVGRTVTFRGQEVPVQEARDEAFRGVDLVLGAAENDIARRFAPAIVASGAVFVDNSSAFRLDPNVPLVVPEVNPEDVKQHHGIIANPNCSTIITITAVNALNSIAPIRTMTASTYQAVSGAGAGGPIELMDEVEALREGKPVEPRVFTHQIAYNLIPQIGNTYVSAIKDTSVLSIISIVDLFFVHKSVAGALYTYFESATIVMVIYLTMTLITSKLLRLWEKKMDGRDDYELVDVMDIGTQLGRKEKR